MTTRTVTTEVFTPQRGKNPSREVVDLEREPNWKYATLELRAEAVGMASIMGLVEARQWDDGWKTLDAVTLSDTLKEQTFTVPIPPDVELVRAAVSTPMIVSAECYVRFTVSDKEGTENVS